MLIEQQIFDSYLAMIKNSVGSKAFRNYYAKYDGKFRDGLKDGELSCAFYVSSILTIWRAIDKPHATVRGLVIALEDAKWKIIKDNSKPKPGDVLIWEAILVDKNDKAKNEHCGFYIGNNNAVSASWQKRGIVMHDWQFKDQGGRKITAIYRGKKLMPNITKET